MQTIRTNLTNGAPTQYTNFNFQSMCVFNGAILGAGDVGVRKLCCGTDDAGTPISAYFITPTFDYGKGAPKRGSMLYADIEGGNIQASLTGDGKTTIGPYVIETLSDEGAQRRRVPMGRGLKWHWASVKVENVEGSNVALTGMDMMVDFSKGNY